MPEWVLLYQPAERSGKIKRDLGMNRDLGQIANQENHDFINEVHDIHGHREGRIRICVNVKAW